MLVNYGDVISFRYCGGTEYVVNVRVDGNEIKEFTLNCGWLYV